MKKALTYAAVGVVNAALWIWGAAKAMLDWIGRGAAIKDSHEIARWFLDTPWYVPTILAVLVTGAAIYALLRRGPAPPISSAGPEAKAVDGAAWKKPPESDNRLTVIHNRNYSKETVDLDGRHFIDCTFDQVTLRYHGTAPAFFTNCTYEGEQIPPIHTKNMGILNTIQIMAAFSGGKMNVDDISLRD